MDEGVAALDLGTNSTRFLCVPAGVRKLHPRDVIDRDATITRLGENVDTTGVISDDARRRVTEAVRSFDRRVRNSDARWVGGVATSACRRADDASVQALFDAVETVVGFQPELLSGDREARLTYHGVHRAFPDYSEGRIVDIGGGSTEWMTFGPEGLESARSLSVGVVTLLERCGSGSTWEPEHTSCVARELDQVMPPQNPGEGVLVGVGGTPTTLSALLHDLDVYDPEVVHGDVLDAQDLRRMRDRFGHKTFDEIGRHPMIQPGREDVIVPGLLLLERCLQEAETTQLTVSDFGILAGYLAVNALP